MQNHDMTIQFWGVRGNLPVPGKETLRYGGNTNCVTLHVANQWFIFDAGSGIKKFSEFLGDTRQKPFSAHLFISHPHWDHINALPHFDPFYSKENTFNIYAGSIESTSIDQLIFGQMNDPYYPITVKEMSASLLFHKLKEESFKINDIDVQTIRLNHPGICLGYRIQYQQKVFCYITDNELPLSNSPDYDHDFILRLKTFIKGADVVVMDATYSDAEYQQRIGWGHACVSQVAAMADSAKVKKLCLFHHCPSQKDVDIDAKLKAATDWLKQHHSATTCIAPHEDDKLII